MPFDDVKKFSAAAEKKANLLKNDPVKYFIRAIMAGFFISVAMIYSNVVANVFRETEPAMGKFLSACVFAIAVLLIVFIGSELFTGNNFIMAFGAYDKKVSWADVCKVWVVSYIGNFVGCLFFSMIFVWAGASGTQAYFDSFIHNKLAIDIGPMFFRAILANFFVCLAVAAGTKCKEETTKFLMIVICISGFVIAGFEHCIANMATFTVACMVCDGITVSSIIRSMVVVTIGNIIGGGVLLALPLRLMSDDK